MSVSSFRSGTSTFSRHVPQKTCKAMAYTVPDKNLITIEFSCIKTIGVGSYGKVVSVNLKVLSPEDSDEIVSRELLAMKICKTNYARERDILAKVSGFHRNIVQLKYCFEGTFNGQHLFFLAMEYFPESLHGLIDRYKNKQKTISLSIRNLFMKNILAALEYLHSRQICHRDIKSQNILVDVNIFLLKLADFGISKVMKIGEESSASVGARFYRAPELLCGNKRYNFSIDIWSASIVFIDMIYMRAFFEGSDNEDQLKKIFEVLGFPDEEEKNIMGFRFPNFKVSKKTDLHVELNFASDDKIIDLFKNMMKYNFTKRISAREALAHPYFIK